LQDYRWTTYVQRVPVDAGAAVFPAVRFVAVLVLAERALALGQDCEGARAPIANCAAQQRIGKANIDLSLQAGLGWISHIIHIIHMFCKPCPVGEMDIRVVGVVLLQVPVVVRELREQVQLLLKRGHRVLKVIGVNRVLESVFSTRHITLNTRSIWGQSRVKLGSS